MQLLFYRKTEWLKLIGKGKSRLKQSKGEDNNVQTYIKLLSHRFKSSWKFVIQLQSQSKVPPIYILNLLTFFLLPFLFVIQMKFQSKSHGVKDRRPLFFLVT